MSNPTEGPNRIDYLESADVTEIHAAVQREKPEPSADVTPMPLWLTGVCGFAVVWAGVYFGVFNGGLSGNVYNEYESSPAVLFPLPQKASSATAVAAAKPQTLAEQGKGIFTANCQACHQASGLGVPGQFPPLTKSTFVNGGEKRLIAILLKGIAGSLTVEGKPYNNQMPAWEATLSPKKIAAVASYIRQDWGNSAPEISESKVVAAKKEFASQTSSWNEAQLLAIPADATLPDEGGGAAPAGQAAPAKGAGTGAPAATVAGAPAGGFVLKDSIERGKGIYLQTCMACHQPTGMGVPGAFPPLAGTEYTQGDARRMVAMTIKGVNPPLKVKEMVYPAAMPPLPIQFPMLADDKNLADVINYVRNSFGNKDDKGVTPEEVGAIRKEFANRNDPWTEAELKNFPSAAK